MRISDWSSDVCSSDLFREAIRRALLRNEVDRRDADLGRAARRQLPSDRPQHVLSAADQKQRSALGGIETGDFLGNAGGGPQDQHAWAKGAGYGQRFCTNMAHSGALHMTRRSSF